MFELLPVFLLRKVLKWNKQTLNSKSHRLEENPQVDRDKFLEEFVDAFNFFFSVLIMSGFSDEDLYQAYLKKDQIIHERLKKGY